MKRTREQVNIVDAYHELGSYRAARRLCGIIDVTVKRVLARQQAGGPWRRTPRAVPKNTDPVLAVIEAKVRATDGRISAKRLGPAVGAAGYTGSARNLRRAVARVKATWKRQRRALAPDARGVPGGGLDPRRRRPGDVLRRAGLEPVPVRALRAGPAAGHHPGPAGGVLRGARRGPRHGAHRSDGLSQGRGGGQPGGPGLAFRDRIADASHWG